MPNSKHKKTSQDEFGREEISVRSQGSSLAEFTRRDLPSDTQVEEFEEYIEEEARDGDIEESLSEIYQDDNGDIVDVRKLERLKRHGLIFRFFTMIVFLAAIGFGGYYAYDRFFVQAGADPMRVEFGVESPDNVLSGEEFFLDLKYHNRATVGVKQVEMVAKYPDNFTFISSDPEPVEGKNNYWQLGELGAGHQDRIRVKGKMFGPQGETGIVLASMTYMPDNFSSSFSKESSRTTLINGIGMDFEFDRVSSAYIGEETEVLVRFNAFPENYISDFRLIMDPEENLEFLPLGQASDNQANAEEQRPGVWMIQGVTEEEQVIPLRFKITEKRSDEQSIALRFQQGEEGGGYHDFYTKELPFDILKSDLNLTLILNGSRDDQGIDLGQKLNYSLVYANRGETSMRDVVIMAVLESDFLDWTTLDNPLGGKEKGNTITWSKQEIPELNNLMAGEEGMVDFSIEVMDKEEVKPGDNYSVTGYAQYRVGNASSTEEGEPGEDEIFEEGDNRSNVIVGNINSDLGIEETVLYFNEDNVPVGTGPHPPSVGQETSYKVYWKVSNSLHELEKLAVRSPLPKNVQWNGKAAVSVGSIEYLPDSHEVYWHIGRLPLSVNQASGEFSVSITPVEDDRNKLMVLTSGTTASAMDGQTEEEISVSAKAQTTKLEDDEIASSDGIVR